MPQDCCLSRRHFVGAGAAALTLAVSRPTPLLVEHPQVPWRALYDERFEAGHRFRREAASRGWVTRPIRGDVTQVWFHELALRWQRGPAAIAGLTTPQSLFVLERLAWDVRMRVVMRDTHVAPHLVRWLISLPLAGGNET